MLEWNLVSRRPPATWELFQFLKWNLIARLFFGRTHKFSFGFGSVLFARHCTTWKANFLLSLLYVWNPRLVRCWCSGWSKRIFYEWADIPSSKVASRFQTASSMLRRRFRHVRLTVVYTRACLSVFAISMWNLWRVL